MINKELLMLGIFFSFLIYQGISNPIFGNPTVFLSQYCNIGFHGAGMRVVPCVTPTPQQNIISTAVAFTEFSKPDGATFRLGLSVNYDSDPATTFNIDVQYISPVAGMYIGVFLVIIKQQTTNLYIDLVNLKWGNGTPLYNFSPSAQTNTQSVDLTLTSIFTTVPSGLRTLPFVSSWRILTPINSTQGFYDKYIPIEFELTPQINGNILSLQLAVSSFNQVQQLRAFVILFNPLEVAQTKSNGLNMGYLIHPYSIGSTLDLKPPAVEYGPGFNLKCILGFYRYKFLGLNGFQYSLENTSLGNYSVYKQIRGAPTEQDGTFFCFGNGTTCGQGYTHLDLLSLQCYLANTCPLPVFTGWTLTNQCPSCIQLICETCDVAIRKYCTKCLSNTNSHLQDKGCVCDNNYIEVFTPIDTSSLGLWNKNSKSLSKCLLNCSAVIEGCKTYDCTNASFCTSCQTNYAILFVNQGNQNCTLCRILISNCTQCSSTITCTNCDEFYGIDSQLRCTLCELLVMPGCLLCEESSSCLTCVSSARMIKNVCRFCNETYHCIDCFVTQFLTLECSQCSDGFYLSNNLVTSTTTCESCQKVCDYCKECLSQFQCVSCLEPYLIGSTGICDQCINDYQFIGGFCMKQAGCISLYKTPQGEQICLACANVLHFVMNTTSKKCVCDVGYEKYTPPGSLMSCIPICGDGIPLLKYEQCDDNNTKNEDGCDMNCKVQDGFECSIQKPSQCVLLLEIKSFQFNHALRVVPQNKAILSFSIQPVVKVFKKLNWRKLLTLEFFSSTAVTVQKLSIQFSQETNQILITVPYNQQLQQTILQTKLELDPSVIKSQGKQIFFLANQLKGKNAPLLFESAESLSTYENINTISMIIIVILLVQFYLGSYTHKMIGLETIQIIQTIYFVRMIASSASSSLLQSMNTIQFSATGYQNAQLIFGDTYDVVKNQGYKSLNTQFIAINMEKYFLVNINLTLVPLVLVIVLFFVKLKQKINRRRQFVQTKEQQVKDNFVEKRRSCQWVYEHLVFPFVMMFNMVCFFFSVLCFTSNTSAQSPKVKLIELLSFPTHVLMLFGTIGIYCNEIFKSVDGYLFYKMSEKQRQRRHLSMIEKLQQDTSNPDRANYHPLYVLVHCLYYLILEICLVFGVLFKEFSNKLELTLAIVGIYFLLIVIWRPYHRSINIHNKFLIFNHASLLIFLIICEIFAKVNKLPSTFYIVSMYLIMVLLSLIMIGGFIRIFLQNKFRKSLQSNSSLLNYAIQPQIQQNLCNQKLINKDTGQILPKNFGMMANNPYVFNNQLKVLSKKYGIGQNNQSSALKPFQNNLTQQQEIYIIEQLRKQYKIKKQQDFIKDILQKEENHLEKTNVSLKKVHDHPFFENNPLQSGLQLNDQFIDIPNLQNKISNNSTNSQQMTRLKQIKAKLRSELHQLFI